MAIYFFARILTFCPNFNMDSKKKLVCKKAKMVTRINAIFNCIDWILFLGFSILAAHFMIDVIHQYQTKATSFSQSLEPIAKMPTIVMCIEGDIISKYGKEIKLDYYAEGRLFAYKEKLKENRTYVLKNAQTS